MQFLSEKIGNTREKTTNGYLVLRNVPIARTGEQLYAASELPSLTPGNDGLVRIDRSPEAVFEPDAIKSFQGVPVTLEHPVDDVEPSNWKELSVGVVLDVRQGTGINDGLLIADLLITDEDAIDGIERDEYSQVSAGYLAKYVQEAPGQGRQVEIRGNHLALLSGAGRCGSVCAIGDSASKVMSNFFEKLKNAFIKANDEYSFEQAMAGANDEAEEKKEEVKDDAEPSIADLVKRIEALEAAIKTSDEDKSDKKDDEDKKDEDEKKASDEKSEEEEDEDEDEEEDDNTADRKKSRDAASVHVDIQDVVSRAEILAPGLKLPTFDAAADVKTTDEALCQLRRRAMIAAFKTERGRDALKPFVGDNPKFKTMDCASSKAAFIGASELLKRSNNASLQPVSVVQDAIAKAAEGSEINRINREFWSRN